MSLQLLIKSKKFLIGMGILIFFIGLAVIAPLFTPDPKAMDPEALWKPPLLDASWEQISSAGTCSLYLPTG
jgi:hypothetical protein